MLKIKVNETNELQVDVSENIVKINGKSISADSVKIGEDKFHFLVDDQSYTIELIGKNETGKEMQIVVNGVKQNVLVQDEFDELLKKLGMDKLNTSKMNEVKAPMPGLVLRMIVAEGDHVAKGDALLVLEAMKMENIIKATGDGVVKKILAQIKQAVEKNQVLIVME
ncbi:MAG: biotin/lipoyl-containing protein [Bacteroidota bacterium]